MSELNAGDMAPDFSVLDASGKEISLAKLRGKNVVLYFYPKDDTPGCTIEAKEFTQMAAQFADANTLVFGVSYDDASCHKSFIEKFDLKVGLLCDVHQTLARAYGTAGEKYPNRDTFVIGSDGKIKKIFRKVSPQGHAQEVLAALA